MSDKIFLFDDEHWLLCSEVSCSDGMWRGYVINGNWKMSYDQSAGIVNTGRGNHKTTLTWIGDVKISSSDYNEILEDAKLRFIAGEKPNFELNETLDEDEEIIPF